MAKHICSPAAPRNVARRMMLVPYLHGKVMYHKNGMDFFAHFRWLTNTVQKSVPVNLWQATTATFL
jgi:hypothetical protein